MSITIISEQTVVAAREGLCLRLATTTKHSKIAGELRDMRLLVRDIVETTVSIETTVSNELHPLVRQRLTEIAQLLQVYARLAELELAAGGRLRFLGPRDYGLPGDTAGKTRKWAEKEGERAQIMEGIAAFNRIQGRRWAR